MRTTYKEQQKLMAALISSVDNSKINWKNQSCSQRLNDDGMVRGCVFLLPENVSSFGSLQGHTIQPPMGPIPGQLFSCLHHSALFACLAPSHASLSLNFIELLRPPLWMRTTGYGEHGFGSLYFSDCPHLPSQHWGGPEAKVGKT